MFTCCHTGIAGWYFWHHDPCCEAWLNDCTAGDCKSHWSHCYHSYSQWYLSYSYTHAPNSVGSCSVRCDCVVPAEETIFLPREEVPLCERLQNRWRSVRGHYRARRARRAGMSETLNCGNNYILRLFTFVSAEVYQPTYGWSHLLWQLLVMNTIIVMSYMNQSY